jgi:hypothetical protein
LRGFSNLSLASDLVAIHSPWNLRFARNDGLILSGHERGVRDLGLALRWSYGSAFGLLHGALRRTVGEPWASAAFGATLMTATVTLFPLLGHTPPPWRWPADVMATSLGTHVAYVAAVAAVDDGIRRRTR